MRLMSSKLSKRLPRPSLGWLSIQDVIDIRNKLIALFLAPGECIYDWAETNIEVSFSGIAPRFRYSVIVSEKGALDLEYRQVIAWLKIPKEGKPYWDVEVLGELNVGVNFKGRLTDPLVDLFKQWKRHFPHKPSNNFLLNEGKPIV